MVCDPKCINLRYVVEITSLRWSKKQIQKENKIETDEIAHGIDKPLASKSTCDIFYEESEDDNDGHLF